MRRLETRYFRPEPKQARPAVDPDEMLALLRDMYFHENDVRMFFPPDIVRRLVLIMHAAGITSAAKVPR